MAFSIGQIVEVDATGFLPGITLQTGDRGTVITTESSRKETKVSWHRTGHESWMASWRLRVYVNPMDAPGRAQGSNETMQALRVVLQEEECRAMELVRLDLERARMTAEDLRGKAFSPYGTNYSDPNWRFLTWREFANDRREMTETMIGRMDSAQDLIEEARHRARRAADSNGDREDLRVALIGTQNILVDARRALCHEDSESEEMSDEETGDASDS